MKRIECPRCGGSGETEFSHVMDGICFLCKGNGTISQATLFMSEEKKQAKLDKKIAQQEVYLNERNNRINIRHEEAKKTFDYLVDSNNIDLEKNNEFNFCVKMLKRENLDYSNLTKYINDYGSTLKKLLIQESFRLALVKFLRLNGVFNSEYEYKNDEFDLTEYENI